MTCDRTGEDPDAESAEEDYELAPQGHRRCGGCDAWIPVELADHTLVCVNCGTPWGEPL